MAPKRPRVPSVPGGMPSLPPPSSSTPPAPPARIIVRPASSTPQPYHTPSPSPSPTPTPSSRPSSSTPTPSGVTDRGEPRTYVRIDPATGLIEPGRKVASEAYQSFKNEVDPNGINWKGVSPGVKNAYFEEFKKKFWWDAHVDELLIRKGWEYKARKRYTDFVHDLKTGKIERGFISVDVWANWERLWADPDVIRRSEIASANRRASGVDGRASGSHCAGSVDFTVSAARIEKEKGRHVGPAEVCKLLHTKNRDGETYIAPKAQAVVERYEQLKEAYTQEHGEENVDEPQLYSQAAGGKKKGVVFGVGSESRRYYSSTSHAPTGSCSDARSYAPTAPPARSEEVLDIVRENIVPLCQPVFRDMMKEMKTVFGDWAKEWMSSQPRPSVPSTSVPGTSLRDVESSDDDGHEDHID